MNSAENLSLYSLVYSLYIELSLLITRKLVEMRESHGECARLESPGWHFNCVVHVTMTIKI